MVYKRPLLHRISTEYTGKLSPFCFHHSTSVKPHSHCTPSRAAPRRKIMLMHASCMKENNNNGGRRCCSGIAAFWYLSETTATAELKSCQRRSYNRRRTRRYCIHDVIRGRLQLGEYHRLIHEGRSDLGLFPFLECLCMSSERIHTKSRAVL